jgi:mRNA interferase RelE/StbE
MKYSLKIISRCERDLDAVEGHDFEAIKKRILSLSDNPRPFGCKKMTADEGYRIRCGDYRVLYRIDEREKTVIVYRVKHRREAYR